MPDLATLAKVDELQKSNAEIAATVQKIGTMRKIVSDSTCEELQCPRRRAAGIGRSAAAGSEKGKSSRD